MTWWATKVDGVCTQAPRSTARCRTGANDRTVALTSSGRVRNEQSCTVTTLGSPDGGTTKLVPWTTSAPASGRRAVGRSLRPHARSVSPAG